MLLRLLPGLYLAALGLLLAGVVRRWLEPLPWRVVLAFGVLVLALFHPVLMLGEVLLPLDTLRGYPPFADLPAPAVHGNYLQQDLLTLLLPAQAEVRAAFARGEWPLWNARGGVGTPLLGDPQSQALQPLVALALPLSLLAAPGVVAALRVLVALLGTWLFLRRLAVSEGPALVGALAWGLGGFVLLWLGWPLANAAALLPVALWATARAIDHRGRRDLVVASVALAALLLAGQPEAVFYAIALVAAFAAARAGRRTPGALRGWAAAAAIAGLLAAPALLPAVAAARQSERAARLAERGRDALAEDPASRGVERPSWRETLRGRWVPLVAPNAFGNDRYLHYWGAENVNEDASGFVGTAAVLLALLGLLARRGERLPQEGLLQGALAVAAFGMALPPALRPWLDRLPPPLSSPSYHHRLLLLVGFCLACLAACELERWTARRDGRRRWPAVVALALALAALVSWAYLAHPHPLDPATLAVLRDGWLRWHLRILAVAAAALLLLRGRPWLPAPIALLAGFELLLAHLPANPPAPGDPGLPPPPVLARLGEHLRPPLRIAVVDDALPPAVASLWGLADVRAHNPMVPASCAAVLAPLAGLSGERLAAEPPRRLLRLLGVGGAVGVPATAVPAGWREVDRGGGSRGFVEPKAQPLVWLPAAATPWVGGERDWLAWAAAVEAPGRLSLLAPAPGGRPWQARQAAPQPRWWLRQGRLSVDLVTPRPEQTTEARLLATSLCDDGGWHLVADGVPRPATRANGPFVAAWLPAGARRLELVQRPRGFLPGALLGGLGLATLLLAGWASPVPARGPTHRPSAPGR